MSKKQTRFVLVGLLLGILLEALDGTIVGTALPKVVSDLGGVNLLAWVFSAYILTSTVSTPLYGKLSDLYGRLPFYLTGMVLFMSGSLACGLAQNMTQLVIFRGVQGLGAGAMMPVAITIAQTVFPPEERGKMQAAFSGAFGFASVVGPTLGGLIVDNFDWRWVFFFSIPFGIAAVVILFIYLPEAGRKSLEHKGPRNIDLAGAAWLAVGATALMLGFEWGGDDTLGWGSAQALAAFAVTIVCLIGFIVTESRTADPIVPLNTFRNRTFTVSVLLTFLSGAVMMAIFSYLPLYMQGVLGVSATNSGTTITPAMIALVAGTAVTGSLVGRRIEHYKWVAVFSAIVMMIAAALMMTLGVGSPEWTVIVFMIIFGFGLGITFPLFSIVVATSMERRFLGVAMGLLAFFRNLGNALSVALFGSILAGQLKTEIVSQVNAALPNQVVSKLPMDKLSNIGANALTSSDASNGLKTGFAAIDPSGQLFNAVMTALKTALSNSVHTVFVGGAIVAVITFVVSFALKNDRLNLAKLQQQRMAAAKGEIPEPELIEVSV